jgi:hypothetical protein
MLALRRTAPLALALAVHAAGVATPGLAHADAPRPSGAARPQQDLIARGQSLFDDQQYEESIQTLSGALVRPSNTKAQKLEIYRLLALNYITLNRKDEAESAVRGLLSLDPTYELPKSESPRFRDFFAAVRQRWEAEGRPGLVKEAAPAPAPVTMKHASPSQIDEGTQVDLTATLEDPGQRVVDVKLFYRTGSNGPFEETNASVEGDRVTATIPRGAVKAPIVEYYLQGFDKGGLPVVSRGDAAAPLRIAVPEPSKGWVLPLAIGGGVVGAAAIVGGVARAGVFKGSSAPGPGGGGPGNKPPGGPNTPGQATVNVSVGEAGFGARW